MCKQIDKKYACGHMAFMNIRLCAERFKTCLGPSGDHEVVLDTSICVDCERKAAMPAPHVAK